jgi:hypothetical protein
MLEIQQNLPPVFKNFWELYPGSRFVNGGSEMGEGNNKKRGMVKREGESESRKWKERRKWRKP